MTLQLADALEFPEESDVNVTATMININSDSGDEILGKCSALMEYAAFVAKVREKLSEGANQDAAIAAAVDESIEEGILREILVKYKSEVTDMVLTEFKEERHDRNLREEGREEGREEREQQMRALYLAMKRDGRRDEYDDLMESGNSTRVDMLLGEYGLAE